MGKSSMKSTTKVKADPAIIKTTKPLKKGKREAEDDLETKVKLKKQKKNQKKKSENKLRYITGDNGLSSADGSKDGFVNHKSGFVDLKGGFVGDQCSSDLAVKDSDEEAAENGNIAAFTPPQSSVQTIYVEGFGSSLPEDDIKTKLSEHFSACGEITRVFVPTSIVTGAVKGFAYIDLKENAKKALELNGSVMMGKELVVKTALLMRDPSPGYSGSDRGFRDRFSGRFGGLDVGGRFRGGRCGGLGHCLRGC